MIKTLKKWFDNIVGKKLNFIYGLIYIYETKDIDHPQELQIIFDDKIIKKISCAPDGSSIRIDDSPMIGSDLGEYGKQSIIDISNIPIFHKAIGRTLENIEIIKSETEQCIVGVRFEFYDSIIINILTLGDEISYYNVIPSIIIKDERLVFISISAYCE